VFLVGAGVLFLAFVLSLMLKEVPLRTMSGAQARAAAAAAEAAGPPEQPGFELPVGRDPQRDPARTQE
jgi:hypothetical protein